MHRRRIDDASALLDHLLAHATLAAALAVVAIAIVVPSARAALGGACVVAALASLRLIFHPLRLASLKRVYVEGDRVLVAHPLGRAKPAAVVAVEHDAHAPWPCALVLEDGSRVQFVARRDDGSISFLDLELSDRARYERPRESRDSLLDLELKVQRARR